MNESNVLSRGIVIDETFEYFFFLWKNKISVLVGDFFLSKALLLSTENKDYDLFLLLEELFLIYPH